MMLRAILFLAFSLAIVPDNSFAFGPRARARAAASARTSSYYSYSRTTYYDTTPSYGRRIDYDSSDYKFPYRNGEMMHDSDGDWKWDEAGQVWRGPVSVYQSYNNGPWTLTNRYWRK